MFCKLECYQCTCDNCGVDPLKHHLLLENYDQLTTRMHWVQWTSTGYNAEGRETSVPVKDWSVGTVQDCLLQMCDHLEEFALHPFNSHWHQLQFNQIKDNLPQGTVLQVLDFS